MGFWGTFVVYRGSEPLPALLPSVMAARDADRLDDPCAPQWQIWRVWNSSGQLPDDTLEILGAATGAPVLAGQVMDSDAVHVFGLGDRSGRWTAWLQIDGAIGHLEPAPAPFDEDDNYLGDDWTDPEYELEAAALRERLLVEAPGGQAGARRALEWAAEAGLTSQSAEAVPIVLDDGEVFAEDLFFRLLTALGVCEEQSAA
jgi:hypothetical protein